MARPAKESALTTATSQARVTRSDAATKAKSAKGGSARVARRRDRRKAEIVHTATKVLAETGYQGMNLEDVAERTDIAKATLYHYFSSKDELVGAALESLTQEVLRRLSERRKAVGEVSAPDLLAALIDEQVLILTETAPEVAAAFSWPRSWPAEFEAPMKDMRRRHDRVFRTVVERGIKDGSFRVPDIDVTLQCLHGVLNQSSVWVRPGVREGDRERIRREIVDACLRMFV